jgi:hypothetical protein
MLGYDGRLMARAAGSLNHEKEDAEDLAAWNVDYFKYDNCYNLGQSGTALISFNRYKAMGDALNATGRPILYSLCSWGEDQVHSVCDTSPFPCWLLLYLFAPMLISRPVGNVHCQLLAHVRRHLQLFYPTGCSMQLR